MRSRLNVVLAERRMSKARLCELFEGGASDEG